MQLKDMALTAAEAKDDSYGCCPSDGADPDAPKYPYGLEICLRDESLKKLGLGLMPVGTVVMITARAVVTGTSSRDRQGSEPSQDMDVQIEALDLTPIQADRMAASASKLYPDAS